MEWGHRAVASVLGISELDPRSPKEQKVQEGRGMSTAAHGHTQRSRENDYS